MPNRISTLLEGVDLNVEGEGKDSEISLRTRFQKFFPEFPFLQI